MSFEQRMPKASEGTVASRIQAFQDVTALENRSPSFRKAPRVLTQAIEAGTFAGRGRRSDSQFASPAGRVSRDGAGGARGDGRPPVGTIMQQLHPSMESKETYIKPHRQLTPRPHTSFGEARNEFTEARLRLRSVIPEGKEEPEPSLVLQHDDPCDALSGTVKRKSIRSEVFEELGNLIDEAIEEHIGNRSDEEPEQASPKSIKRSSTVKSPERPKSQALGVRRSQSVAKRRKDCNVDPKNSSDADRVSYRAETPWETSSLQITSNPQPGHQSPKKELPPVAVPPPKFFPSRSSPVKERAAMFERLVRKASTPKAVHKPPIDLVLPQLSSPRRRSHKSPESSHDEDYVTAPHSGASSGPATAAPVFTERIESRSWPFKWGLSTKTPVASPQQTDLDIKAQAERDERKTSTGKIRGKVQNLLAAVREKQMGAVIVQERNEPLKTLDVVTPRNLPPLLVCVEEEEVVEIPAEDEKDMRPEETDSSSFYEARATRRRPTVATTIPATRFKECNDTQAPSRRTSPIHPSANEKEVLMQSGLSLSATPRSGSQSPVKREASVPTTPIRGRNQTKTAYGVEQRFTLSRSRSKNGGVKVSVEVRASPERPHDEAIVVVKANLEPMSEEVGDGDGDGD